MNLADLKIEAIPLHKSGGQSVGMPRTGIQITHLPTGLVAFADSGRSQMRSKNVALAMIEYGLAEMGWKKPFAIRHGEL